MMVSVGMGLRVEGLGILALRASVYAENRLEITAAGRQTGNRRGRIIRTSSDAPLYI